MWFYSTGNCLLKLSSMSKNKLRVIIIFCLYILHQMNSIAEAPPVNESILIPVKDIIMSHFPFDIHDNTGITTRAVSTEQAPSPLATSERVCLSSLHNE